MSGATPQQQGAFGFQELASDTSDFNALTFLIESAMAALNVCTPVQVKAVNTSTMTVDVLPLVNQITGAGLAVPFVTVYNLPYFRLQGGAMGVICDPVVGDIGMAVICDRDISAFMASHVQSNPGSLRRFNYSDGFYIGGWNQTAPTTALKFAPGSVDLQGGVLKVAGTQVLTTQQTGVGATPASYSLTGAITGGGGGTLNAADLTALQNTYNACRQLLAALKIHGMVAT